MFNLLSYRIILKVFIGKIQKYTTENVATLKFNMHFIYVDREAGNGLKPVKHDTLGNFGIINISASTE